jgi:hypothetical protein
MRRIAIARWRPIWIVRHWRRWHRVTVRGRGIVTRGMVISSWRWVMGIISMSMVMSLRWDRKPTSLGVGIDRLGVRVWTR